jgi:DNA-binding NtrC family response regulator
MKPATILIADDEARVRESLKRILAERYLVVAAANREEVLQAAAGGDIDLVVLDYYLSDCDASELLPHLRSGEGAPEVIVISGKANTKEAVASLKLGAADFILKPYEVEELLSSIENALKRRALESERGRLVNNNLERYRLIGSSAAMAEVRRRIKRYAVSEATVLIEGETGTGKELVAHQLHYLSRRAGGPLQVINCAAVPKELADSELFGHARGAFTGAVKDKPGKVELAEGGTLFLDEIGDMPLELQAKLLRFLETGEFERLGENRVRRADIRLVAATNRDLGAMIGDGAFRNDLFYRLNVCRITCPPLREHKEDIPELADAFIRIACARNNIPYKSMTNEALSALIAHIWPGNVRELLHFIEQTIVFFEENLLDARHVRSLMENKDFAAGSGERTLQDLIDKAEREIIISRLAGCGGRIEQTADSLGIHRSSLHRKMTRLGIQPDTKEESD